MCLCGNSSTLLVGDLSVGHSGLMLVFISSNGSSTRGKWLVNHTRFSQLTHICHWFPRFNSVTVNPSRLLYIIYSMYPIPLEG